MSRDVTKAGMYCRRCLSRLDEVEAVRCPRCGRRFDAGNARTYRGSLPRHPWLRSLLRGTLRAAVVVVVVLSVTAGWLYFRYAAEQRAMNRIVELGGAYESRPRESEPTWLRQWAQRMEMPLFEAVYSVDLQDTATTDRDMRTLKKCSELVEVNLERTEVSDRGLRKLRALAGLEKLHIGGTNVTEKGVEELRRALPDCEVVWP